MCNTPAQGPDCPCGFNNYTDGDTYSMSANLAISEVVFTLVMGCSLVSNLLCVFNSTFIMMWGPRRALMAREADMESILIRIRQERRGAIRHFLIGVFSFLLGTVVTAWCYWQGPSAITATVICFWGMWELQSMQRGMREAFNAPPIFSCAKYDPNSEPLLGDLMSQEQLRRDLAAATNPGDAAGQQK